MVISTFYLPMELSNRSLNLVGIFENHKRFRSYIFAHAFSAFTNEIFFEQINLIVLPDASLRCSCELLCCFLVGWFFAHFFLITCHRYVILGITTLGPASFVMEHSLVLGGDSVSVHRVLGVSGDVVHVNSVGVSANIVPIVGGVWHLLTD
jgi:hypothetical protein